MIKETLQQYAAKCEIDIIGIAPAERFKDVPPQLAPFPFFRR
jgi:hypothetical protein